MAKAELFGVLFEFLKFGRRHVALDRKLTCRRLKILPQGDDIDVVGPKVAERRHHFITGLANPEHHPRFRQNISPHLFSCFKNIYRASVGVARPDFSIEARYGFNVVIEHMNAGLHDGF